MSEEVQRSLGRIEGKLDGFESKLDSFLSIKVDHETRIRALERWMWRLAGGTAVALVVLKLM